MGLISSALAPVLIIAFYVYFRDKYEKEPLYLLSISLCAGSLAVVPVLYVGAFFCRFLDQFSGYSRAAYTAFVIAAFTEESFKFVALFFLIWGNRNFNEKFDGIVYAVFISLGFAAVENILYVTEGGYSVGVLRAFTAVPGHAFFGIIMGYYYGLAKYSPDKKIAYLVMSYTMPLLFHGVYDFMLMSRQPVLLTLFIPFILFAWKTGFNRMRALSDLSIYQSWHKNQRSKGPSSGES